MKLYMLAFIIAPVLGARFKTEREIWDHLLKNYSTEYRPVKNASDVIWVKMQLIINQILQLDEKNQVMTSQSSFLQVWKDEFLEFNESDYDAQLLLTTPKNKIWGMDLYVKNSVGDTKDSLEPFHRDVKSYIPVTHDGYCMSYNPFVLHTSCAMDIAYFPFDVQTCNITTGSWNYDSRQLKLSLMDPPIWTHHHAVTFGAWELTDTHAAIREVPYKVFVKDKWKTIYYDEITFSITLNRNPTFYINNIVIPTAILGVVAIFSFLLPPESGERISLCLTSLLAIAVYAMVVADNVPESSRNVPLITCLLFLYMTIMAASTLWSVLATRFYFQAESYTSPPGKYWEFFARIPVCTFCRKKSKANSAGNSTETQLMEMNHHKELQKDKSEQNDKEDNQDIAGRWRQVLVGLDMILFILFLLILVAGTLFFLI